MASRINTNLRWVKRKLDMMQFPVVEEEILDAFNRVQLDIMERTGSVKETFIITLDGIATTFPTPAEMGRPFFISQPINWNQPLQFTNDPSIFDYIAKGNTNGQQPTIVMLYNDQLVFNVPGTSGDVLTFYTSVFPTDAQDSANMVEGGNPILSKHWDTVLRLGALDDLLVLDKSYPQIHAAFTEAYNQEAHNHIQEGGVPMLIDHSSNRLGF